MGPAFVLVEIGGLAAAAHGFQYFLAEAPAGALAQVENPGELLRGVVALVGVNQEYRVKSLDNGELTLLKQGVRGSRLHVAALGTAPRMRFAPASPPTVPATGM